MAATALYYNNHTDVETGYGAAPVYQAEGTHNNAYPSQTSVVNQRKSDNKVCIFITIGVIAAILILVVIPVIVVLVCCCCIIDEATDIAKDYDYCVKNPKDSQCTMWQPTYDLAYCSNTQHKNETGCQQLYKFCADNDKKNPKPAGYVSKCQGGAPPQGSTTAATATTTKHGGAAPAGGAAACEAAVKAQKQPSGCAQMNICAWRSFNDCAETDFGKTFFRGAMGSEAFVSGDDHDKFLSCWKQLTNGKFVKPTVDHENDNEIFSENGVTCTIAKNVLSP